MTARFWPGSRRATRVSRRLANEASSCRGLETEPNLVELARAGDDAALTRLVDIYAPKILRFGMKLCRDDQDAQDVAQQTLLSMVSRIGEFRGESHFTSWLFAIARSHCIKLRTRGAAAVPTVDLGAAAVAPLAAPNTAPDETASREQLEKALHAAIQALEPSQREVLVLRDVEGLSAPEVAEALNLSVDAVKSRLHRARKALRDHLEPWFEQSSPRAACPDVVELLSRYHEGDVTSEVCKTMEAHVAACAECAKRCHSLRSVLSACSVVPVPELSDELKLAVRAQIRRSLKRQLG